MPAAHRPAAIIPSSSRVRLSQGAALAAVTGRTSCTGHVVVLTRLLDADATLHFDNTPLIGGHYGTAPAQCHFATQAANLR